MKTSLVRTGVALALAATMTALAIRAEAATFAAWEVAGVAWGDTLNVRKYPASTSQKQSSYPNGTILQMTGKCTGGVNLRDMAHLSQKKQRQLVRYQWCQVWHDPKQDGDHVLGWVYGRYIAPY